MPGQDHRALYRSHGGADMPRGPCPRDGAVRPPRTVLGFRIRLALSGRHTHPVCLDCWNDAPPEARDLMTIVDDVQSHDCALCVVCHGVIAGPTTVDGELNCPNINAVGGKA